MAGCGYRRIPSAVFSMVSWRTFGAFQQRYAMSSRKTETSSKESGVISLLLAEQPLASSQTSPGLRFLAYTWDNSNGNLNGLV